MENSGIALLLCDPSGRFLEVNEALCGLLQRPAAGLRNASWPEITHPADLAADQELLEQLQRNQRQSYCLRKRFLRPNGDTIWGDLHVACVRHNDGAIRLLIAQIVDVSAVVATQTTLAQREQDFRQLANRLELAAETAGIGIYDADLTTGTAFYSAGFLRNLGYEPGDWQASQEEWFSRLHPEERVALRAEYEAMQDGSQRSTEYRMRHRNGSYRWFLGHGKGIDVDATGRARRIVGICLDVTERRLAEASLSGTQQQLEQERAELRATLDGLLEPHILLAPVRNGEGRIVDFVFHDANPAACTYNRRSREQLIGTSLLALLPAHRATGLIEHYAMAMESSEPLVLDDYAYPNDILGEERRYDIRARRVGKLLSYSWRDVSERHRTAQRLEASERRFRLLAENATDVVLHMRNERIVWVSPSVTKVLGWLPEDWIGRPGRVFLEPADQAEVKANLERLAAGQPISARNRIRAKDGSWHWMDTRASQFLDELGQPDGVLAAGRLVDAEVMAEQALERKSAELAIKLRTSLTASVVAHEINQPLSLILLQAQLARDAAQQIGPGAAALVAALNDLTTQAERVETTIERMRMLLRNVQSVQVPLDLNLVVENALLYQQQRLEHQHVRLERSIPPHPVPLLGDAAQLQLAIGNLIRNSVDALAELAPAVPPRIRLTLTCEANWAELRVADNGPGFGDLDLGALPLTTTKQQGMGLGLYVVQTTAANHGGTMVLGSSPLGGAEVTLRFPLDPAHTSPTATGNA